MRLRHQRSADYDVVRQSLQDLERLDEFLRFDAGGVFQADGAERLALLAAAHGEGRRSFGTFVGFEVQTCGGVERGEVLLTNSFFLIFLFFFSYRYT